jgi:predicted RNA-binding protein with PIN domain
MSLQYIIDGYNVIHHATFTQQANKKTQNPRFALLELIKRNRLTGSVKNKVTLVFDGYPNLQETGTLDDYADTVNVIFSRKEVADNRIKKILEDLPNPKNAVVVSDDKEIRFFAKSLRANVIGVKEFIGRQEKVPEDKKDGLESELTYSQMHKINQELRKIWLK